MSRLSTSVDGHMPCNPALGQLLPYDDDYNWYELRCTLDPEIEIVIQMVRAIRITTLDHELWWALSPPVEVYIWIFNRFVIWRFEVGYSYKNI